MSARIRKRNAECDVCGSCPDRGLPSRRVPFIVEVNDSATATWYCPKHFERDMKIWRKADALVRSLEGK